MLVKSIIDSTTNQNDEEIKMKNKNSKPAITDQSKKSRAELFFDNIDTEEKLLKSFRKKKSTTLDGLPELNAIKIGRS